MSKWQTTGPLPGLGDEEIYLVWRECEDGLIEEAVYSFTTEWDSFPNPPGPTGPVRVGLRVYSPNHTAQLSASRIHAMKMPPYPIRKRVDSDV